MTTLRSLTPRAVGVALAVLLAVVGLGAIAVAANGGPGSSTVTRARLERSLPVVFANVYAEQARLLGHTGVTPASLDAQAMCDKGGAQSADVGPGSTWVCLMSWTDTNVPMPSEGYGKFELNVHSNDCYTAGGPSKLTGYLTLTDTRGREVSNPAFEFDGCFDPGGDDTPTGHTFPSVTSVISTTAAVDARGRVGVQLGCGTGADGCVGTATLTAGSTTLGTVPYEMTEESTTMLHFPTASPAGATEVELTLTPATGYASSSGSTLPVQ
ncbi:hypothetical protein [Nocardioides rubriscoriae]|uniref:hypothetical protein n=1 Tax=Nocardioides rubriscoriae TaxID=642762 RepID=UPI0011DF3B29|nr:hypothetical protein [Nocardioides rubriscoriae]